MNKLLISIILLYNSLYIFSQTASTYFPANIGHKWFFKNEVLDTLNNPVDSLTTFRIDSFATTLVYKEKEAKLILSKTGSEATVLYQPYLDTNYVNLAGTEGSIYFSATALNGLLALIDTTGIDSTLGGLGNLLNTLASFEKWYPFYKFASIINLSYTLLSYDTTISIDTLTLPLRFDITNRRLADAALSTPIGNFNCKKFLPQYRLSYRVELPPPLPPLLVPLLTIRDTVYIAPGNWIVQSVIPSTVLDLSYLQLPKFSLPGLKVTIIPEILPPVSVEENFNSQRNLSVQIYPNPARDVINLNYTLREGVLGRQSGKVNVKIFDLLGNEIQTLVDEEKIPGEYVTTLRLNDTGLLETLANGIYFYRLTYGNYSVSGKFLLIK